MTVGAAPFDGWFLPPGFGPVPSARAEDADGIRRLDFGRASARALLASLRSERSALLSLNASERARLLGRAGARFLDPGDPLRREAEARVPGDARLSAPMARAVIEGMARDWTAPRLLALLAAELPDPRALDELVAGPSGTRVRAFAPGLSLHVGSGTVPGVSATSLLRSLLVGSATLLKPGAGDVVLPVLLARAIAEEAPDLARALAVVYWSGGADADLEEAAIADADLVVLYGGDDAVRALRERTPATTPVVAYHHRVSVAVVGRDSAPDEVAEALGRAVALFDQRGCVSPHVVFVEEGAGRTASGLARALGLALDRLDRELPPGPADAERASAIHQLRRTTELRAAAGERVELHAGRDGSWTVVVERADELELSCLGRTVRIRPVADASEVPRLLTPWRRNLQTVGVAGLGERLPALATALGALGAARVCPIAEVAFPPPWWHHDGRGPLTSLLRWVDLEG